MTLQTIEVRYEDAEGRHVDVHDAAETYLFDDELTVYSDVCACCDATDKETWYNLESVVKIAYTDSEHEREEREYDGPFWPIVFKASLILTALVLIAAGLIWLASNGGTVSL